jgi:hypothetical protein
MSGMVGNKTEYDDAAPLVGWNVQKSSRIIYQGLNGIRETGNPLPLGLLVNILVA